ncbi:MAG: 2-oxo acid dehydrogenase subunit E2 [Armatimonadetes bacterium]|nr:2-oxo acid dehydrogenase subunit E2 [Armatimonadota bacterium]
MAEVSLRIPQIGEGLQEARLVAVLKQPGDTVKRDEPIYQMETDKAVMDVESPHAGRIVRWLADPDTVLAIGAEVLVMDVAEASEAAPAPEPASSPVAATASATSNQTTLKIPQIGEGLQEARLVAVLKQPGETIARDEAIYQMETDKAVMDVESPFAGTLVAWLAEPDTVLPIGADVALIETAAPVMAQSAPTTSVTEGRAAVTAAPTASAPRTGRRTDVPPRTRAYAKSKGLTDADIEQIAASGSKLMPDDVDAHLNGGASAASAGPAGTVRKEGYSEQPMGQKQRVLMSRLTRGNQLVVPGTMTVAVSWGPIEQLRREFKDAGGDFQPSAFTMFAYAAALATKDHPMFRSTIVGDGTVRTYDHIHLGIAVALPGDELVIARIDDADGMDWRTFAEACRAQIDLARGGKDQANESVTLSLTNMQAFGIRDAVAVVVPPGVATVFLGEPYNGLDPHATDVRLARYANLGITFDHRLINGVGAAHYQNAVKANVENIRDLVRP